MKTDLIIGLVLVAMVLYMYVSPQLGLAVGALSALYASQKAVRAFVDTVEIKTPDDPLIPLCKADRKTRLRGDLLDEYALRSEVDFVKREANKAGEGQQFTQLYLFLISADYGQIRYFRVDNDFAHNNEGYAFDCTDVDYKKYSEEELEDKQIGHKYLNNQKPALFAGEIHLTYNRFRVEMKVNDNSGHYMEDAVDPYASYPNLMRLLELKFGEFTALKNTNGTALIDTIHFDVGLWSERSEYHKDNKILEEVFEKDIKILFDRFKKYMWKTPQKRQAALEQASKFLENLDNINVLTDEYWTTQTGKHVISLINDRAGRLLMKGYNPKQIYKLAFNEMLILFAE